MSRHLRCVYKIYAKSAWSLRPGKLENWFAGWYASSQLEMPFLLDLVIFRINPCVVEAAWQRHFPSVYVIFVDVTQMLVLQPICGKNC